MISRPHEEGTVRPHAARVDVRRLLASLFAVGLTVSACHDVADEEYRAALRGDEDGSSYEERLAHLNRAIALEPSRPAYWESRATLRIDGGSFEMATSDLDRAIALGDRPYLRFLRGLVRCQMGDCATGLVDFDRAITVQPGNAQFYRGRALARAALARPTLALADAEQLVRLAPQVGTSYYARGVALAALTRHKEAIQDFDESLRRMPELVYALDARAQAHSALGETGRAAADREAAAQKRRDGAPCAYCLDPFRY